MLGVVSKILFRACQHGFYGVMSRSLDPLAGLILGSTKKLSANEVDDVRK